MNQHRLIQKNNWLSQFNNKTILITGYSGIVGTFILRVLDAACNVLDIRINLVLVSRKKKLYKFKNINSFTIEKDIRFLNSTDFQNFKIDYVIHGATPVRKSIDPLLMLDICYDGTKALLEAIKYKKIENFLLLSSGAVYGNLSIVKKTPIKETSCSNIILDKSLDAYSIGKILSESVLIFYSNCNGSNFSIARMFAMIGPEITIDSHYIVASLLKNLKSNENLRIIGDGRTFRSYLNTSDMGLWLLKILCEDKKNSIYNVGSPVAISTLELAKLFKNVTNYPLDIDVKNMPSSDIKRWYVPSIDKIISEIGVEQNLSLEESIRDYINEYT